MNNFGPALALLIVATVALGGVYGLSRFVAAAPRPLVSAPYESGNRPAQHAVSRFHVRWYPLSMVFLAFDMEMVFMYPWTLVVVTVGPSAVIEMFVFLGVLLAGVVYAWREGALRWT